MNIYNVFYVLLLKQDIIKKGREFLLSELEPDNNKEHVMEAIRDSAIYVKKADKHLPKLYYLVVWKGYLEEKNTWESFLAVIYLVEIVNTVHKDHPEKLTATSAPLDSALSMAKPIIQLSTRQKQG